MKLRQTLQWACCAVLLLAIGGAFAEDPSAVSGDAPTALSAPHDPPTLTEPLESGASFFVGSQTCATATCHGGVVGRGPAWNSSASLYGAHDPHAASGAILRDADSARIVAALDPSAANSSERFDHVLRTRCISCHLTVSPAETQVQSPLTSAVLAGGVACESCHGAASAWIEPHVRSDWQGSARFAAATGMRDTEGFVARVDGCVRCHVGSRRADGLVRDVNHDLIAAGHPPLRFEPRAFLANLPPHWDESGDRATGLASNDAAPNVRRFMVGRIRALRAAALLTAERVEDFHSADEVGSDAVWPELADFDCFACHQALLAADRIVPAVSGQLRYNPWLSAGLEGMLEEHGDRLALRTASSDAVLHAASALAARVDASTPAVLAQALESPVSLAAPAQPISDWHDAAAWYFKNDAIIADLPDSVPRDQLRDALDKIHQDVLRLDSPTPFNIQRLAELIDEALAIDRSANRTKP